MGRPAKVIDPRQVEALAAIGCTTDEIALVMECSDRTLERRFVAALKKGRSRLNMSLRRKQVEMANNGNVTMLVWLGKQYLGQSEKIEAKDTTEDGWVPDWGDGPVK